MANKQKQKEKAQKLLASYGRTISKSELKEFEKKFDTKKAKDFAKETGGVRFGKNAQTYYKGGGAASTAAGTKVTPEGIGANIGSDFVDFQGRTMSRDQFGVESEKDIRRVQGDIEKELEVLRNASEENIANISAGAQRYGYDADERARKYVADRAGQSAEAVENIRAKGNLDLQAIVNAGLKDVESIRGQFGVEQEKTRGEFGVKQEETRQAGLRDTARIAGRAGIYQGLMGAFNF